MRYPLSMASRHIYRVYGLDAAEILPKFLLDTAIFGGINRPFLFVSAPKRAVKQSVIKSRLYYY